MENIIVTETDMLMSVKDLKMNLHVGQMVFHLYCLSTVFEAWLCLLHSY
jgi:hypothetical protein